VRATAYDAYGNSSGVGKFVRFGYAGGIALPEAGLVHMRARAYDPSVGRFVSADPSGYAAGINLYTYTSGDPINRTDPTGLDDGNGTNNIDWGGWGTCSGNCAGSPYAVGGDSGSGGASASGDQGRYGTPSPGGDHGGLGEGIYGTWNPDTGQYDNIHYDGGVGLPAYFQNIGVGGDNSTFHNQIVQELARRISANNVPVNTEVLVCLKAICSRLDLLLPGPIPGIALSIDVKTGLNPKYTDNQLIVYPHLESGPLTVPGGSSALGIGPGGRLPPTELLIYTQLDGNSVGEFKDPFKKR